MPSFKPFGSSHLSAHDVLSKRVEKTYGKITKATCPARPYQQSEKWQNSLVQACVNNTLGTHQKEVERLLQPSERDIERSLAAAKFLHEAGEVIGTKAYPHEFMNHDKLPLSYEGPWYEFPVVLGNMPYNGKQSPGRTRVIFTDDGERAGVVAHSDSARRGHRSSTYVALIARCM